MMLGFVWVQRDFHTLIRHLNLVLNPETVLFCFQFVNEQMDYGFDYTTIKQSRGLRLRTFLLIRKSL